MAQRRFHYEQAFEHYLRANGIPYVAVDEAKRALQGKAGLAGSKKLKSFDFVVYSESGPNLLIDVKGRKHAGRPGSSGGAASGGTTRGLQNWVTRDDVQCLETWSGIFGRDFEPTLAFLYWFAAPPPDALFLEVFEYNTRWYAILAVRLDDYRRAMRDRSAKWDTVSVPAKAFEAMTGPLGRLL